MTFNQNADISGSRVRKGGGAMRVGGAAGGLGVVGIIVYFAFQLLGGGNIDLTQLTGAEQATYQPAGDEESLETCLTGADANDRVDCRMQATALSLDDFWQQTLPTQAQIAYELPEMRIFTGQVSTGCGTATSATGPFYCPADATVYLDTTFFDELSGTYGATGGPLAELYVVSHEFGHHIQNQLGTISSIDRSQTGPTSDQVRLELQADCYAGMWVGGAAQTTDANGVTYLQEPTESEIADALSAAEAVGDDHIQETFQGQVTPHNWTHGSSAQRQQWFLTGLQDGSLQSCDTFAVPDSSL